MKHWSLGVSSIPRWLPTGFFAERPSGSRVYSVLVVFVTFQGTNTYPTQREKENHLQIYTLGWGYVSSLLYVFVTIFFRGGGELGALGVLGIGLTNPKIVRKKQQHDHLGVFFNHREKCTVYH